MSSFDRAQIEKLKFIVVLLQLNFDRSGTGTTRNAFLNAGEIAKQ